MHAGSKFRLNTEEGHINRDLLSRYINRGIQPTFEEVLWQNLRL